MRVLILTIVLLGFALPALACDYNQASGSSTDTTTATSTVPSSAANSGG